MERDGVVRAARGWRIAQRGMGLAAVERELGVEDVSHVRLPDTAALEGRTLDGVLWRRLWSLPDRLVIEFVDVAAVEFHDQTGSVIFDRALPRDLEQHLLLDHVLPLALARRGELVLHGAVLTLKEKAAVLVGPSGAGKSTLAAYAGQHGWTVGGDDGAVLQAGPPVTAEPTYSTVRLTVAATELLGMAPDAGSDVVGKRRLESAGPQPFRRDPAVVGLIAFVVPVPADRIATVSRLRGAHAHATLFGTAFHTELGRGDLLRSVVNRLAIVTESVTVARLAVPRGREGLAAAEIALRRELSNRRGGEAP